MTTIPHRSLPQLIRRAQNSIWFVTYLLNERRYGLGIAAFELGAAISMTFRHPCSTTNACTELGLRLPLQCRGRRVS